MSPEEYQSQQKAYQQLYEVVTDQAEKKAYLDKMINLERDFCLAHAYRVDSMERPEIKAVDPVSGQSVTATMDPKSVKSFGLFKEVEKLTPENFRERVHSVKGSNGKSLTIEKLMENPEFIRRICDAFNYIEKSSLEEEVKKNPDGLEMYETADSYGVRPKVENTDAAVKAIVERADQHAAFSKTMQPLGEEEESAATKRPS